MTRVLTIALFVACGLGLAVLQWRGASEPGRAGTLGAVLRSTMSHRSSRMTVVVFWWWLGWHFFVER
ncbi:hypothetical protein SAMN04515671_2701 [Nakamurella panacisegetis]|uniref:Uncharacterized protein n=1 Tax=Nakamurella panacisegetis TaxID=1090615 RepID=A0A1H0PAW8_9ACTN|nr:DUF6186 family protein [Nakamurella panacisegetis]SDP02287.1 hypothetical protein SAMN04515671_2701 [Nakamurella panacisegetis]